MAGGKAKRILRYAARGLLGLVALVLILSAAGLIWLRTDSAVRFLTAMAVEQAARQGIHLGFSGVSGPLPQHLRLQGVTVADSDGPFFTLEALEIDLRLLTLLRGTLEIRRVALREPVLLRQPALPSASGPRTESGAPEPLPRSLPVGIVLEALTLERGRLAGGLIQGGTASTTAPDFLDFGGHAALRLETGMLTGSVHAGLFAGAEEIIGLDVAAEQGGISLFGEPVQSDSLRLRFSGQEGPNGLISSLTGTPLPGYALQFEGSGPVKEWQGRLSARAGSDAASRDLFDLEADVRLATATGSLWRDFVHTLAWKLDLSGAITAGTAAPRPLPALAGEALPLSFDIAMQRRDITANARLGNEDWSLALEQAQLQFGAGGSLDASGRLLAVLAEPALLEKAGLARLDDMPVSLGPARLDARLNALRRGGDARATVKLSGAVNLEGEDRPLAVDLAVNLAGPKIDAQLDSLAMLDITAQADAHFDAATKDLAGQATLRAKDDGAWQKLLTLGAGVEPERARGSLAADIEFDWPAGGDAQHANLALQAANLRLPEGPVRDLLGGDLSVRVALGREGKRLTATVSELRAGMLDLTGQAVYGPGEELDTSLRATVRDIKPFGIERLSGPLALEARASGPLAGLRAEISMHSDALETPGGEFADILAQAAARFDLEARRIDGGSFNLAATHKELGPAQASSLWTLDLPGKAQAGSLESPLAATVTDLRIQGLGVQAAAQARAVLPSGQPPEVDGEVRLGIDDISPIAEMFNLPLSLRRASANLNLDSANGQSVHGKVSLDGLRLNQDTPLELASLTAGLTGEQLYSSPVFTLDAALGEGRAGPLEWAGGGLKTAGNGSTGAFAFSLAALAEDSAESGGPGELLRLGGSYDLPASSVTLSELLAYEPEFRAGLELEAPLTVHYGAGIEATDIRAKILPEGRLEANVRLTDALTDLSADIRSFPFEAFKPFTSTALPAGDFDLGVTYRLLNETGTSAPAAPEASIRLHARVDQPAGLADTGKTIALEMLLEAGLEMAAGPAGKNAARPAHLKGTGTLLLPGAAAAEGAPATDAPAGNLDFSIPLLIGANGLPQPETEAPLHANFAWSGPVDTLWQFAPMPGQTLTGFAQLSAEVAGSLAAPLAAGSAYLAGGTFEDTLNGILMTRIALEAHAGQDGTVELRLTAQDATDGSLAVEGSLFNLLTEPVLVVRGQIRHLKPMQRDDLSITLSGLFNITGPAAAPVVGVNLLVERGELTLAGGGGGSVRTLDISNGQSPPAAAGRGPTLNVQVDIPRYFFVRGLGLDSEWGGSLSVKGPVSGPELFGSLKPVRGQFDLLSKPFVFSDGDISFTGGRQINPAIDLELTYTGGGIQAVVKAGGTLNRPRISLESQPPLPEDEVLAHVLFGKSASTLSHFEALQLANGLRELASVGEGGLNPLMSMRKSLGLDVLRVGGGQDAGTQRDTGAVNADNLTGPSAASASQDESSPTLEAGKYLSDSIYMGVEQGFTAESTAVRVEIELLPNVTLQGRTSPTSSQVGIGWKKDY